MRLNHVMLLHSNHEKLDEIDLDTIEDQIVQGSEHLLRTLEDSNKHTYTLSIKFNV